MSSTEPPPVPARGARQREAGAASRRETRRLLLLAAGELFTEHGYTATTVSAISERADVSLQTLYLAWGSKRALLRAFLDQLLSEAPDGPDSRSVRQLVAELPAQVGPDREPRAALQGLAHLYRLICERLAPGWKLYRDAAAVDPEISSDWAALLARRRTTVAELMGQLPVQALRPGLTPAGAGDTAWAITSPDTYDLLVRHGGLTLDAYEQWVGTTLVAALLAEA